MAVIVVNDVLDELGEECRRLASELLFANQCLEILFEFKFFLDAICRQFGDTFDDNLRQRLRQLEERHQSALSARPPPEVRAKSADRAPNSCRKRKYEFACDWIGCEFVTNRKSRLRAHLNRHCGLRPFRCEKCEKEFVGKEALSAHEKAVHATPTAATCVAIECARRRRRPVVVVREERPFACQHCDYRSRTRQALREHASTHAQRSLKCDFCEKRFKNRKQIRSHVLTHSSEPLFKCKEDNCSAAFRTAKTLRIHRLRHANTEPRHACAWPGCDFTAAFQWLLARHHLTHTGEKPFECETCGQRFARRHNLAQHALKHSGERPFRCCECSEAFRSRQTLRSHARRMHSTGE